MHVNHTQRYKAIVIGAGQGGGPLASAMAGKGWQTALIERGHVGGTCINTGCTPTKTMIASAQVAHMTRRAFEFGVEPGNVSVNMAAVRQRKRDMVKSFRQSSLESIEASEVELIRGEARFTAPKTLEIRLNGGGKRKISADTIVIDTGARPRLPDIPGLGQVDYLDSTTIMELDLVPEHLVIIGGGYVGVEFGQMFRRFGSQVTIVQRAGQLLTHEDVDVAGAMRDLLEDEGLRVLLNSQPVGVMQVGDGAVQINVNQTGTNQKLALTATHLLIATGRTPNSQALDLENAGIETDEDGYIRVNERLEASVTGVFAIGDVKGEPAFTHISYDDYRILSANLLQDGQADIDDRLIPYTVFTDPQLGRIGLTEKQAHSNGIEYHLAKMPMTHVARALEIDQPRGFMKALVDPKSQQILGCAILGHQGGEIMAMLQVAMMAELPYSALHKGTFTHPTLAEAMNTLFANPQAP
jgi:pyruvate/2-oxoglutarate dehydrogenase complex dihydrolipoamide dehydrogenase (E3) component